MAGVGLKQTDGHKKIRRQREQQRHEKQEEGSIWMVIAFIKAEEEKRKETHNVI